MRTDTEKGAGKIEAVNPEEGWLEITIGNRQAPFAGSFALVPSGPLMDAAMRGALKRFGEAVFEGRANHQLIGGTAWLFSCPEMVKRLDYLFIDEAGQVSLADVVASGLAARNIVLVGDQMQLLRV